jgi:membrane protease YdiL (CAAX protease family)
VLDLVILSLGFMIHLWSLPYTFKNLLIDSIVRFAQLAFGITILVFLGPEVLPPNLPGILGGAGVGLACFGFQLLWNRGARPRGASTRGSRPRAVPATRSFIASQFVILLFQVPAEEVFYRGVFFTLLASLWGPLTALLISTALSTMTTVVSTRRPIIWLGSGLMGILCGLGYYWAQSIWTPILIHVLNDFGYVTLKERRDIFKKWK